MNLIDENINVDEFGKFLPIAELVLAVIPSKNQQQKELFNVYKHFKPSINEILIDDDSFNLKYYDKSNEIILSKLCQFAEESGSLEQFQNDYSLNEEDAINSLNLLYKHEEFLSDHSIIPNKEGKFMCKNDLRNDPKIDEKIFDLFTKLDQNSEIPEDQQINSPQKNIHPKVKIEGIDVFGFCKALNKKIKIVISNPNVDREIIQMINDCIDIDFTNMNGESMSEDQKVRMNILHNAHIAFIKNRIRELSSPKPSDFQRWPFELIQNATDCIQDSSEKIHNEELNGDIGFIFNDDEVIFKHYGAPFTHKNLISLMYQYGGEKEGKSKIGRFGTGFLSTLILSRKVIITSDLQKENGEINGFTVTIDRSGNTTEELKKYIGSMEGSLNTELPKKGFTRFVFKLPENKEENKNCYKAYNEGIRSLNKYIAPSMIINPKIRNIIVKTKGSYHHYTQCLYNGNEEKNNHIKQVIIKNLESGRIKYRKFIYYSSHKLFNDKNIKVECLLEVGSKKRNIISSEEFLFLQFPMFGKKEFKSPIIINSPNFEPETERNDIIINSKQLNETPTVVDELKVKNVIDDKLTSINKFIILESINLFRSIIQSVLNYKCVDLFDICYGLKYNSNNKFYQEQFINVMRSIILKSDVFEYAPGVYKKCKFIIIPFVEYDSKNKETNINRYKSYYDLVSQLNYGSRSLLDYSLCINWLSQLWPDFKHRFDIQQFLGYISQYDNVDELPFNADESINKNELFRKKEIFFDELIQFLQNLKKRDIFGSYKVFLNNNKRLVPYSEIVVFNWNNKAKKVIFEWMNFVKFNYQDKMLSDGLKHLYQKITFNKFPIGRGIHEIEDRIDENNSIYFMNYIILDDKKRELMHKFTEKLLDIHHKKVEISMEIFEIKNAEYKIDDIINNMYRKADEFIIDKLIDKIQDIDVKNNLDFLFDFVKLCKEILPSSKYENYKFVPNKNFKLCNYRRLSKDELENEKLKEILKKVLNLDINEHLVHEKFNEFVDNKMNLNESRRRFL